MRGLLANSYAIRVEGRGFLPVVQKIGLEVIAAIAIPLLLLVLAAICGNMIQHRLVWSGETLKPKLSKISPLAGFKRLFSKQALVNFVKGLIKLALLGAVMTALLWPERKRLDTLVTLDPAAILPMTQDAVAAAARRGGGGPRLHRGRPISCSSTGSGSSGRRCRSTSSRTNSSRPKAIRM